MTPIDDLLKAPNLRELLDELENTWQEEQRRRHQFWADVDEAKKAEFILGEIIYHSPVYGRHWMASTTILGYFIPHVRENRLGKVGVEKVMVRLTRNDYQPDICFWNKEKADRFEQKQSAFPPPDFVVEILSDSTRERDYGIKMTDYALHGVKEYWIVDVEHETVEQYLLHENVFELAQKLKDGFLESEVVSGFRMSIKEIFSES
ncbi:Uma2 family endonuclease [Larkinella terrae]|uniref:Uma2 family endonuclease n=1 Tax=Larkinella terrae TaxID=2025311 RepID=A0A7K0ET97_9BACT|nr:Uma2 family endonuclease [Larkinella terrae]MRS64982.1 Uma2 family endonuclease [Larkinella terrae]